MLSLSYHFLFGLLQRYIGQAGAELPVDLEPSPLDFLLLFDKIK